MPFNAQGSRRFLITEVNYTTIEIIRREGSSNQPPERGGVRNRGSEARENYQYYDRERQTRAPSFQRSLLKGRIGSVSKWTKQEGTVDELPHRRLEEPASAARPLKPYFHPDEVVGQTSYIEWPSCRHVVNVSASIRMVILAHRDQADEHNLPR